MNARRRLQREIVRRRRRDTWPLTFTRITTPNGTPVRVFRYEGAGGGWGNGYVDYQVPGCLLHAPWPPTPEIIRELGRWA